MPLSAEQVFLDAFLAGWQPEPEITVSQWADEYRILSSIDSAEPGRWRNARTPYLVEIQDRLSPNDPTKRVVFIGGSQIGKTASGLNFIGCIIHTAPGPVLMVYPTVDLARNVSKQRIAPMIAECPVLSDRVKSARSRDSGNTTFTKEFPGGMLMMTGANSASGLKSRPIRYLFADEIDEYPGDVEGQGDPIKLAEARLKTYSRISKTFLTSTPTIRGVSRIENAYLLSDQRRYFVPCPLCGHMDWIRWENIRWENDDPETVRLVCVSCTGLIDEVRKTSMMAAGEWQPTAESQDGTVGYQLSSLYSPVGWMSWAECVTQFLEAKNDPFKLKTFVNNVWAETWEERGEGVSADAIEARLESYEGDVPNGVGCLLASVDLQGNRLEVHVVGFGAGEESWLIAFHQIVGDPLHDQVWHDLDRFLSQKFQHQSGRQVGIDLVTIDSGYLSDQVYRYCRARLARRVFAVKGTSEIGKPVIGRPSMNNRYRAPLYVICTDQAKEIIYGRLRIKTPGPGYMHLPASCVDREYIEQLTSETPVREFVKGRGAVRKWIKTRPRNEALDLTVYTLAGLYILGPSLIRALPERAAQWAIPTKEGEPNEPAERPAGGRVTRQPKPGGFVNRWRR